MAISTFAFALCITPALAIQTQIANESAPVQITACTSGYGTSLSATLIPGLSEKQEVRSIVGFGYDFTNVSGRPISVIRFAFAELDAFGEGSSDDTQTVDWVGVAAPGQSFSQNRVQGQNLIGDVEIVRCFVQKVKFTGGSVWNADAASSPTGLYYPPTASPTP